MVRGFTANEIADIREKLKEAARTCASSIGMRKTTVDELCAHAGISKGAFYKFYAIKEELFFEIFEEWHARVYGRALEIILESAELPDKERVSRALIFACHAMEEHGMAHFYGNDVPLLLRKIPQSILEAHYHSDEKHIADLIVASGIKLKASPELASAAVRTLILSFADRSHTGPLYPQVLDIFIKGVCDQIIE